MAGPYQVGKVTGPSRPSDLYGATYSFTQAAGLVEGGNEMSRRITPDFIEVAIRPAT